MPECTQNDLLYIKLSQEHTHLEKLTSQLMTTKQYINGTRSSFKSHTDEIDYPFDPNDSACDILKEIAPLIQNLASYYSEVCKLLERSMIRLKLVNRLRRAYTEGRDILQERLVLENGDD